MVFHMTISSSGLTPSPSADGLHEVGAPRSSMSTEYLSAPLLSVWVWACTYVHGMPLET